MDDIISRSQKINELNGLIDLAEKTSEKFHFFKFRLSKIRYTIIGCYFFITFFLTIIICAFLYYDISKIYQVITGIFSFLCLLLSFILIFYKVKQMNELKIEIESERKILLELLNMISGIKESVFLRTEISFVEKAIIEMRLSRISFSTQNSYF